MQGRHHWVQAVEQAVNWRRDLFWMPFTFLPGWLNRGNWRLRTPFSGGEIFRGGASAITKSYTVLFDHVLFWLRGGIGTFQLMLCNHDDSDDKDLVRCLLILRMIHFYISKVIKHGFLGSLFRVWPCKRSSLAIAGISPFFNRKYCRSLQSGHIFQPAMWSLIPESFGFRVLLKF